MARNDEEEIIQGLRTGQGEAYHYVFRTYYPQMCHVALALLHDEFCAEEVAGDVISHMWEMRERLDIHKSLRSMLLASVRNACINRLHTQYTRLTVPMGTAQEYASLSSDRHGALADPLERLLEQESIRQWESAVESLPPVTRRIFKSHRFEGNLLREIAKSEHMSLPNVKYHIRKAINLLHTRMVTDKYEDHR